MPFPSVPNVSKKQLIAAADILKEPERGSIGTAEHARRLLSEWRACHLFPLDYLAKELQERLQKLRVDGIVALRLKRLFRIVEKLRAFETMNVTRMQDIAGFAIVPSVSDAVRVVRDFEEDPPAYAEIGRISDYIASPKASGYRSVHLPFRHKGSEYGGLRVELQVRTDLQHLWASAVEISGMLTHQRIKYDEGSPEWMNFFCLAGEAFARKEGTPSLEKYSSKSDNEIRDELASVEKEVGALAMMRDREQTKVVREASDEDKDPILETLLLQPDLEANCLTVRSFPSGAQDDAIQAYSEAEQRVALSDGGLAPVLVSVDSLDKLGNAYRSFFMDVGPFADLVQEFIEG